MFYVRLMNSLEAVSLDQLDDTAKTGLHIGRQRVEFISNAIVEQLYDPSHQIVLSHFCNAVKRVRPRGDLKTINDPVMSENSMVLKTQGMGRSQRDVMRMLQ